MKLTIVGGVYFERCIEPRWDKLFGSAGRAAASIAGRKADTTVVCTLAEKDFEDGHTLAAEFKFKLEPIAAPTSVHFDYVYALATPRIYPAPETLTANRVSFAVEAENVLRYGMMEAAPKVTAKAAVYDPQSAFSPERFSANGSSAERLAIVLNRYEGRSMTGKESPDDICAAMMDGERAEVVVLKDGVNGCFVSRKGKSIEQVRPYPTKQVFKIGSGDIFSSNFTYAYLIEGADAVEAATAASRAVAHYVSQRYSPTPQNITEDDLKAWLLPDLATLGTKRPQKYDVYLAGPFFDLAQLWLIHEARFQLRDMGLKVFSPYNDVGLGEASLVVPQDIEGLKNSSLLFCCLDGLDSGTIFEIGYARANGIPCIYYSRNETSDSLKMLDGTNCLGFSDFSSALYATGWYAKSK